MYETSGDRCVQVFLGFFGGTAINMLIWSVSDLGFFFTPMLSVLIIGILFRSKPSLVYGALVAWALAILLGFCAAYLTQFV